MKLMVYEAGLQSWRYNIRLRLSKNSDSEFQKFPTPDSDLPKISDYDSLT